MSPFSKLLHELRVSHGLRQAELAERLGYEQSYISALEVGLKGPPTDEFLDRMSVAMFLTETEQENLRAAAEASQRKLVIDQDAPPDVYWLLNDLRNEVRHLTPVQIRLVRQVLTLREAMYEPHAPVRCLKRRRKEEAPM